MIATSAGGLVLAAALVVGGAPVGGSPGVPTSTVKAVGDRTARYCVSGYAPNVAVSVRNEPNGAKASIRTNNRGSGCTNVPVATGCSGSGTQTLVAAGTAADGNPGTSSVRTGAPACVAAATSPAASSPASGAVSVTHVVIAVAGACCLALVVIGAMLVGRRRRSGEPG